MDRIEKFFESQDIYLASWLSYNGRPPMLRKTGDVVVFRWHKSQEVMDLVVMFNTGAAEVNVLGFANDIRRLRAEMYGIKYHRKSRV